MWPRGPDVDRLVRRGDRAGLLKALGSSRAATRASASAGLARVDPTGSVEPLRRVLEEDPAAEVRTAAAQALVRLGSSDALSVLGATAMTTRSEPVLRTVVDVLTACAAEDDRCVAELARSARHASLDHHRPEIVAALGTLDSYVALEAVDTALADPSAQVRAAAVSAVESHLGAAGEAQADPRPPLQLSPHVLQTTRSSAPVPEDLQARAAVAARRWDRAVALGGHAVEALVDVLEGFGPGADADLRAAAETLGRIRDARVTPVLTALLDAALADRDRGRVADLLPAFGSTSEGLPVGAAHRCLDLVVDVVTDRGGVTSAEAKSRADARAEQLRTWDERRRVDPVDDLTALQREATTLLGVLLGSWPAGDPERVPALAAALQQVEGALSAPGVPESLEEAYLIADDSDVKYHELAGKVRRAKGMSHARDLLRRAVDTAPG